MSPVPLSNFVAEKFDSPEGGGGRRSRSSGWASLRRTLQRALPQSCAFCAAPCGTLLVCAACSAGLARIDKACPRCALPAQGGVLCGACVARPPPFAAAFAAFVYSFPLDRLLQAFKYGGKLSHADFFAAALAARVAQRPANLPWPDAVVALPLAPARQRERGFDQAAEIARRVADHRRDRYRRIAPDARHACPGGVAMDGTRSQCSRRLCRRSGAGRAAHRHRRRRDDHGRHARVRRRRRAARRRPQCRGLGGRAYTSAGATAMKDPRCPPRFLPTCLPRCLQWYSSTRKFRPTPAT